MDKESQTNEMVASAAVFAFVMLLLIFFGQFAQPLMHKQQPHKETTPAAPVQIVQDF